MLGTTCNNWSPTDSYVILAVMNQSVACMNELGLAYIFLEVDQAIYTVLQILFKYHEDDNKHFDRLID